MKKLLLFVPSFFLVLLGALVFLKKDQSDFVSPSVSVFEKPLVKYSIENLRRRGAISSQIFYDGETFSFYSDQRKITGLYHQPEKPNGKIVVLLHGSADEGEYFPGFGTDRVAKVLTKNGYTTYAPDFLGYGGSDKGTDDDFENRFLTWTTNMDLIASICSWLMVHGSQNPPAVNRELGTTVNCPVRLWAHSNGGQIALSILAITSWEYPTVLWNPVTKPFPYNILYFIDGYKDEGKWLRKAVADFEKDYDVDKYSFDKHLEYIKAPILLQQGEADEWVPVRWNRQFNSQFSILNSQLVFKEYIGADHNMNPKWNEAVNDLIKFYSKF